MNLWRALFGSQARPTVSVSPQPESTLSERDAPLPATSRNIEPTFKKGDRIDGRMKCMAFWAAAGTVYVVYDHLDPGVLALKTLQNLAIDNSTEQRALEQAFEKKASAWIALDRHPYIARASWVQRFQRRLFIGMDYIAPDERQRNMLRHYLVGRPLPLEQVLRWGIEFCHGMEHCFRQRRAVPSGHQAREHFDQQRWVRENRRLRPGGAGSTPESSGALVAMGNQTINRRTDSTPRWGS